MRIDDTSKILADMYTKAEPKEKALAIQLFGNDLANYAEVKR